MAPGDPHDPLDLTAKDQELLSRIKQEIIESPPSGADPDIYQPGPGAWQRWQAKSHDIRLALTDEQLAPLGHDPTRGGRLCGAPLETKPGEYCRLLANRNREKHGGRCRIHSDLGRQKIAATRARGPAHHAYKDGSWARRKGGVMRYSVPVAWVERFMELASDPDYLNLSPNIALVDVRIEQLLGKVSAEDSSKRWEVAEALYQDAMSAMSNPEEINVSVLLTALSQLGAVIAKGLGEYRTWKDVFEAFEVRRKLSDTERKRIESGAAMIRADNYLWFVTKLGELIPELISDGTEARTLQAVIQQLISDPRAGMDARLGGTPAFSGRASPKRLHPGDHEPARGEPPEA